MRCQSQFINISLNVLHKTQEKAHCGILYHAFDVRLACGLLFLLFRHSDMRLNIQEERLATSLLLVTRLHLSQAMVVRLHMRLSNVVILTPEKAGTTGV